MSSPHLIKGASGGPEGKWEAVQAIQHEPFIYIQWSGSHWGGEEPDDIETLLDVMAHFRLDLERTDVSVDPCQGIENPEWHYGSTAERYIDGPRMYAADGVVRFSGNFENVSNGFCIDTNHQPTINTLMAAIKSNDALPKMTMQEADREYGAMLKRRENRITDEDHAGEASTAVHRENCQPCQREFELSRE